MLKGNRHQFSFCLVQLHRTSVSNQSLVSQPPVQANTHNRVCNICTLISGKQWLHRRNMSRFNERLVHVSVSILKVSEKPILLKILLLCLWAKGYAKICLRRRKCFKNFNSFINLFSFLFEKNNGNDLFSNLCWHLNTTKCFDFLVAYFRNY